MEEKEKVSVVLIIFLSQVVSAQASQVGESFLTIAQGPERAAALEKLFSGRLAGVSLCKMGGRVSMCITYRVTRLNTKYQIGLPD